MSELCASLRAADLVGAHLLMSLLSIEASAQRVHPLMEALGASPLKTFAKVRGRPGSIMAPGEPSA